MSYYLYIMASNNNNAIYIGVTNNLTRRVNEHKNEVYDGFTKRYHIHRLVYYEEYLDIKEAILREKQIKNWSREKKNELINAVNPKWKDLMRT